MLEVLRPIVKDVAALAEDLEVIGVVILRIVVPVGHREHDAGRLALQPVEFRSGLAKP